MHMLKTSALACAVALAGCGAITRPPYEAPQVALPAQFEHAQASSPAATPTPMTDAWWHGFGDPRLDAWIDLALARNPDMATAGIRVRRAALQAQLAGHALLPQPSGSAGTGASRPLSGSQRSTLENASATLGVAWELDLFDRLGAQRDAAVFEAQASVQDRNAVALSLTTTTASLYWQLALANERLDMSRQSLEYVRRTIDLVQAQYRSGAVSGLELREARQALAEQQALLSQYTQARAELRLRGALAGSDATAASYYPRLSLTGSLGTSSSTLLDVLANPVAALGANLALPSLNVREMRLNTAIARSQYEEAVVNFRKTLYAALAETEKSLSARTELALQEEAQQRATQESVEITRLYEARYRAGQVPLRTWLDAQERRRAAQLALSALHLARLQNQLTLHKALGGGWPAS